MKTKITLFAMLFCIVLSSVYAEEDPIKEKVLKDLKRRYPDMELVSIDRVVWGDYWSKHYTKSKFGTRLLTLGLYSATGSWIEDKLEIKEVLSENTKKIIKQEGIKNIELARYIFGVNFEPYYRIEGTNGNVVLLNDKFETIKSGPLKDGIAITDKLNKDMNERFQDLKVLGGWAYQDSLINFDIVYRENEEYFTGRVTYTTEEKWNSSSKYMVNYTKLPLELLIFVNDRGGLENFNWIDVYTGLHESFYNIQFKDGQSLTIDENLYILRENGVWKK